MSVLPDPHFLQPLVFQAFHPLGISGVTSLRFNNHAEINMDQCTHYSNDKASYPSTAYQPVDLAFGPHASYHQDTKTEEYASANPEGLTVDRQSQPLGFRSLRWWLAEIMATLVSIASFVAIVVVVRKYRGQGLQDVHLPSQLSLNGLIALLSTVCRIALMIPVESAISQEVWTWLYGTRVGNNRRQLRDLEISDEASRGAWGSFRFLLQARRKYDLVEGLSPSQEAD